MKLYGHGDSSKSLSFSQYASGSVYRTIDKTIMLPNGLDISEIHSIVPNANGQDCVVWGGHAYSDWSQGDPYVKMDFLSGENKATKVKVDILVIAKWE